MVISLEQPVGIYPVSKYAEVRIQNTSENIYRIWRNRTFYEQYIVHNMDSRPGNIKVFVASFEFAFQSSD